jgi:hypothetical protein
MKVGAFGVLGRQAQEGRDRHPCPSLARPLQGLAQTRPDGHGQHRGQGRQRGSHRLMLGRHLRCRTLQTRAPEPPRPQTCGQRAGKAAAACRPPDSPVPQAAASPSWCCLRAGKALSTEAPDCSTRVSALAVPGGPT